MDSLPKPFGDLAPLGSLAAPKPVSRRFSRILGRPGQAALGVLVTIAFLWLALRGADFGNVATSLAHASVPLLLISLFFSVGDFALRALRYGLLVRPERPESLRKMFPPVIVGFSVNNLFFGRPGDFVRAYLVAAQLGLSKGAAVAALGVERLLDVATLLVFVVFVSFFLQLSDSLARAAWIVGVVCVLSVMAVAAAVRYQALAKRVAGILVRPLPDRLAMSTVSAVASVLTGLTSVTSARTLGRAAVISVASWGFAALSVYGCLLAFGLRLSPLAALLVIAVSGALSLVPSVPGNVGTMHLAFVVSLGLLGVDKDTALGVGVVFQALGYVWVTAAGLFLAWRQGLSLLAAGEQPSGRRGQTRAPASLSDGRTMGSE